MATAGGIQEVQGSANSVEIDSLARFAVDDYNKKQNALLEYKKVVNAKQQVVAGTMYYITLEVMDGGHKKVYEAKIWEKPWLNFKEVQEFKLIGDAPSETSA
ncbi:cysteine proteinase inhibitor [Ricinus communis]|uniref:Cysteine proteinase inhibitor n=1 Tax=Ricinus communis TaxID=3988 RepID=B9SB56_RICCO|nr:cysteine proteinase inhibitor [Ricinus communis]EEF39146.1 Cysteine proteinase inhibitor, putative [Ricinus communis]|eukprot:XP_002523225.1 cysteine proteinase inhibitor [Ricinus communis]